jgi:peptide-methionine (S)-S-oxide reductase
VLRSLESMLFGRTKSQMVEPEAALNGHPDYTFTVPKTHYVNGHPIAPPFPEGMATAVFGSGCFWGVEEIFWQVPGVYSTAVGYAGGYSPYPTYEEVCTGRTGHTEAVLVVYDPALVSYAELVAIFFETHDPTQGMRQGNDVGTQYRSAIYYGSDEERDIAEQAAKAYSVPLEARGYGPVTTEIAPLQHFYYAEDYHQQYLAKNPYGYRCHESTGIPFPR